MSQRKKLFDFIKSESAAGRKFPTRKAMADHMGWLNAGSATDALWGLVRDGLITAKPVGRRYNFQINERA